MKNLFLIPCFLLLAYGCSSGGTALTAAAPCPTCVAVTFNNNYGRDMVIAMAQGGDTTQNVTQMAWLCYNADSGSYYWNVPSNPQSNADLQPYIFNIDSGQTLTINVPQYAANVGFRCLVADTAFKNNALDTLVTSSSSTPYMAFPNMLSATYTFDKFEAGLTIGSPGVWNITAVDFLAVPMQLEMGSTRVGFKDGVTAQGIFGLLGALPPAYSAGGTTAPNTATTTYRFFAPANMNTTASSTALDSQIIYGLNSLGSYSGAITYGNFTFSNFFAGGTAGSPAQGTLSCVYTNAAMGVTTPDTIQVNNISTQTCFAGTITGPDAASTNSGKAEIELGALLSAVTCRGVLGNPALWGGITGIPNCPAPWNYYPTDSTFDQYAYIIHQYSIGGKNYAFPYDDYFSEEAGFTVVAGDSVTVNMLPASGTMTATPEPRPAATPGFISVTIPTGTSYPANTPGGWQIGQVILENNVLPAGNTILCSLGSDTINCTFPSFPGVTMSLVPSNSGISFSGTINDSTVTGIVGLSYPPGANSALSFGAASSWQLAPQAASASAKKKTKK
jgi:hypothetical protein